MFYTNKVIIHHLIKITQRTNIKPINIYFVYFELQYMLDGDKKIMVITLNFYIIVNQTIIVTKLQYD